MPTLENASTVLRVSILFGAFITIALIFFVSRYLMEKRKATIKTRTVVIVYIVDLLFTLGIIVFVLTAFGLTEREDFQTLLTNITAFVESSVPKLIGSLVVLTIGLIIMKGVRFALFRLETKQGDDRRKKTITKITLSIAKYIIAIALIIALLSVWGVNVLPALAGLGILGIIIGLGMQKLINDLISGFFIVFEHHFDVGDWVEINDFMGEVIDIGLKTTKVRNFKGEVRIFNNGSIDPVSNFSINEALAIIDVAVAYREDIAKAIDVLSQELPAVRDEKPELVEDPRVLGITNLADSGVNVRVVAKVLPMTQWGIERHLRLRVKEILDQHNIEIPFPQVVVHQPKQK